MNEFSESASNQPVRKSDSQPISMCLCLSISQSIKLMKKKMNILSTGSKVGTLTEENACK